MTQECFWCFFIIIILFIIFIPIFFLILPVALKC